MAEAAAHEVVHEFLAARGHFEALRALEKSSGCSLAADLGEELNFLRDLLLDGDWANLDNSLRALQGDPALFDYSLALFLARRQRLFELVASDPPASARVLRNAFCGVKDLGVATAQEINAIKNVIVHMSVAVHSPNWTPMRGRYDCFEAFLEEAGLWHFVPREAPRRSVRALQGSVPRIYSLLEPRVAPPADESWPAPPHDGGGGPPRLELPLESVGRARRGGYGPSPAPTHSGPLASVASATAAAVEGWGMPSHMDERPASAAAHGWARLREHSVAEAPQGSRGIQHAAAIAQPSPVRRPPVAFDVLLDNRRKHTEGLASPVPRNVRQACTGQVDVVADLASAAQMSAGQPHSGAGEDGKEDSAKGHADLKAQIAALTGQVMALKEHIVASRADDTHAPPENLAEPPQERQASVDDPFGGGLAGGDEAVFEDEDEDENEEPLGARQAGPREGKEEEEAEEADTEDTESHEGKDPGQIDEREQRRVAVEATRARLMEFAHREPRDVASSDDGLGEGAARADPRQTPLIASPSEAASENAPPARPAASKKERVLQNPGRSTPGGGDVENPLGDISNNGSAPRREPWPVSFEALRAPADRHWLSHFHPSVSLLEEAQPVRAIAFSELGDQLAMGTNARSIAIADWPENMAELGTLAPSLIGSMPLDTGSGQQHCAYRYEQTAAPRLRLKHARLKQEAIHLGSVYCLDWAQGGGAASMIASGSNDKTVRLWSVQEGDQGDCLLPLAAFEDHHSTVRDVRFFGSPQAPQLASVGGGDCAVRLWDLERHRPIGALKGHTSTVFGVSALTGSDSLLATSSADGTVRVWDTRTGRCASTLLPPSEEQYGAHAVTCSPSTATVLASGHEHGGCFLWDLKMQRTTRSLTHHNQDVRSLDFSKDGAWLLTASFDGFVGLVDMDPFVMGPAATFRGHEGKVLQVKWHPGEPCFVTSGLDGQVKAWSMAQQPFSEGWS